MAGNFNWTASYRHDSTIVAPYERFVPYDDRVLTKPQTRNFAHGKLKKVAWFVSNCNAANNRLDYARQLSEHIEVDIYGACGTQTCIGGRCLPMLEKEYKFYLSFENANCRDYITEKFYVNALNSTVLPIVMGAAPEDYRRVAPPNSFIHVDDFLSPRHLADYLHTLDANDTLYNQYFQWKGTGHFINTLFLCRVCALAHDVERRGPSWYTDIDRWWSGPGVCIGSDHWRHHPRRAGEMIGDLPVSRHESTYHKKAVEGMARQANTAEEYDYEGGTQEQDQSPRVDKYLQKVDYWGRGESTKYKTPLLQKTTKKQTLPLPLPQRTPKELRLETLRLKRMRNAKKSAEDMKQKAKQLDEYEGDMQKQDQSKRVNKLPQKTQRLSRRKQKRLKRSHKKDVEDMKQKGDKPYQSIRVNKFPQNTTTEQRLTQLPQKTTKAQRLTKLTPTKKTKKKKRRRRRNRSLL